MVALVLNNLQIPLNKETKPNSHYLARNTEFCHLMSSSDLKLSGPKVQVNINAENQIPGIFSMTDLWTY